MSCEHVLIVSHVLPMLPEPPLALPITIRGCLVDDMPTAAEVALQQKYADMRAKKQQQVLHNRIRRCLHVALSETLLIYVERANKGCIAATG